MNFRELMDSNYRNGWIYENHMDVYIRKNAVHSIGGKIHYFLDIANVTVEEKFEGRGIFTKFLKDKIENSGMNVYVENTNDTTTHICKKLGMLPAGESYYYIKNN